MRFYICIINILVIVFVITAACGCTLLLLNGHLSHGYYISPSESFKCKLPGGALSRQLEVTDKSSSIGETVKFKLGIGLLWRVDHLRIDHHKLAISDKSLTRKESLDQAKLNYIKYYLEPNLDVIDINWEQFQKVNGSEILIVHTYLKWGENEEDREILFSIDNEYLNIIHHSQNVSDKLQKITSGALDLYKSCEFY